MTCSRCHTHTCWVCLETFPQGQGIYDHMREFHGGIGL
jgi:predicted aldo/keto reductase-like oxidoreductase